MQIMLSIYLNSGTCIYLSLDNGVMMTSKGLENKNLVSFTCFSYQVIFIMKVIHMECQAGGISYFLALNQEQA